MFAREAKRTAVPVTDGRRKRQVPGVDYHHSEVCQVRTSVLKCSHNTDACTQNIRADLLWKLRGASLSCLLA